MQFVSLIFIVQACRARGEMSNVLQDVIGSVCPRDAGRQTNSLSNNGDLVSPDRAEELDRTPRCISSVRHTCAVGGSTDFRIAQICRVAH